MNQRHPQNRHTPHGGSEKTDTEKGTRALKRKRAQGGRGQRLPVATADHVCPPPPLSFLLLGEKKSARPARDFGSPKQCANLANPANHLHSYLRLCGVRLLPDSYCVLPPLLSPRPARTAAPRPPRLPQPPLPGRGTRCRRGRVCASAATPKGLPGSRLRWICEAVRAHARAGCGRCAGGGAVAPRLPFARGSSASRRLVTARLRGVACGAGCSAWCGAPVRRHAGGMPPLAVSTVRAGLPYAPQRVEAARTDPLLWMHELHKRLELRHHPWP